MKLVTWNLRCQNSGDDAHGCGWSVRLPQIVTTLRDLAPDILAVQETHAWQIQDLRTAFPAWQHAGKGRDDGDKRGEHCAIFFQRERFKLRTETTQWLSPTPTMPSRGWDAVCTRIITRVHLFDREAARELEVNNTHLDHKGEVARRESARWLARQMAGAREPALLCGDFNSAPDSMSVRELSQTLRDARTHAQCPPEGEIATFRGFGEPLTGDAHRIDYVFVDRHWNIESYRVLELQGWPPASDHRPVVVELKLK